MYFYNRQCVTVDMTALLSPSLSLSLSHLSLSDKLKENEK